MSSGRPIAQTTTATSGRIPAGLPFTTASSSRTAATVTTATTTTAAFNPAGPTTTSVTGSRSNSTHVVVEVDSSWLDRNGQMTAVMVVVGCVLFAMVVAAVLVMYCRTNGLCCFRGAGARRRKAADGGEAGSEAEPMVRPDGRHQATGPVRASELWRISTSYKDGGSSSDSEPEPPQPSRPGLYMPPDGPAIGRAEGPATAMTAVDGGKPVAANHGRSGHRSQSMPQLYGDTNGNYSASGSAAASADEMGGSGTSLYGNCHEEDALHAPGFHRDDAGGPSWGERPRTGTGASSRGDDQVRSVVSGEADTVYRGASFLPPAAPLLRPVSQPIALVAHPPATARVTTVAAWAEDQRLHAADVLATRSPPTTA